MRAGERGSVMPLVVGVVLVAGVMVTATIAVSAVFLAQRDLAGFCDGAATTAAARATIPDADGLPALDPAKIDAALGAYPDGRGTAVAAATDGRTVEVRCTRRVRIPFGAVLGAPDGLDRTVVARARPAPR